MPTQPRSFTTTVAPRCARSSVYWRHPNTLRGLCVSLAAPSEPARPTPPPAHVTMATLLSDFTSPAIGPPEQEAAIARFPSLAPGDRAHRISELGSPPDFERSNIRATKGFPARRSSKGVCRYASATRRHLGHCAARLALGFR